MGLSNVLSAANSGLRVTQSSLDIVARNIANADTPGYTRKTLGLAEQVADTTALGVRQTEVLRAVDSFLQTQLRAENAAYAAADVKHQFLTQVDELFGVPGSDYALDTLVGKFEQALQELATTPDAFAARDEVVATAQDLAEQLQKLSNEVQAMRQLAEDSIAQAIDEVNISLQQLDNINEQLGTLSNADSQRADLLDERDRLLDGLSELLDIRVTEQDNGMVNVFLRSGYPLLDATPAEFTFDHHGDISATSLYDSDPTERGVGAITLRAGGSYTIDLVESGELSTGRIGGLLALRDAILPQTQDQLDELAHGLALSFSNVEVDGTAAVAGLQTGFDIDTAGLQPGNSVTMTYTRTPPGETRTVTIVRVDDPTQLPLSNDVTPDPDDQVIGVDFSGGVAAAAAAIQTALAASGITVTSPGGTTLRFLDDGGAGTTDVDSVTATVTATALQDGGLALPLFLDGGGSPPVYSASLDGGSQKLGFASRIAVNQAVVQNNELLVRYESAPETPLGDPARPLDLLARLTDNTFTFSPQSGIGQMDSPYSGTVKAFAQRVISVQTGQVEPAARQKAALEITRNSLQDRYDSRTKVNVDEELSQLIALQNSFAANARVIQAVSDLMQMLFGFR